MTRKTRPSKPGGDDVAKRAREQVTSKPPPEDDPNVVASEAESAPPQSSDQATKKVTLPAFGFAEDLLKSRAADGLGKSGAADGSEKSDESTDSANATLPQEVDAADPRRIFAFADGLQKSVDAEPEAAPVRLETWVAFSLAGEVFALPVAPVREVVRVASITRVPHAPKPIRGVTNRRGRVIPVIDLRLRIELPPTELGRASRVIVVSSRGRLLGLLVDAVHQVIHIDLEQVQQPPDDVMTIQSDYLSGVYHLDDQLILLLDIDRALIIQAAPEAAGSISPTPDTAAESAPEIT